MRLALDLLPSQQQRHPGSRANQSGGGDGVKGQAQACQWQLPEGRADDDAEEEETARRSQPPPVANEWASLEYGVMEAQGPASVSGPGGPEWGTVRPAPSAAARYIRWNDCDLEMVATMRRRLRRAAIFNQPRCL
jgi:hypothetical protein